MKEGGKRKISVCLLGKGLALIFLVVMALVTPFVNLAAAPPGTRLYVNPPALVNTTKTPGTSFTVDINVENVVDLFTWAFELHWDPALLNVTGVAEGPFLAEVAPEGTFLINKTYQDAGYIDEACSIIGDYFGAEGNGTLLTVTFLVEKVGETTLHLALTQLVNSQTPPGAINHTVKDGYFANLSPKIYIDPVENGGKVGDSFTINITAAYMPDLFNWTLSLTWNDTILDATSVEEGSFLKSGGSTTFSSTTDSFTNATGTYERINATCTLPAGSFGVNDGGILANVTFSVAEVGATALELYNTKLFSSAGYFDGPTEPTEIAHQTFSGQFASTRIYVDPERSAKKPDGSLTLNITVADVLDLYTWELSLSWNSTVLEATNIMEGPFLNDTGDTAFFSSIDNTAGSIYANCTFLTALSGVDGSGTVMNITFLVKEVGTTTLNLFNTGLNNSANTLIIHIAIDGTFSSVYPIVDFDILTPTESRLVNKPITFDAPTDKTYDPDGSIASYMWNFSDSNVTTIYPPTTAITHFYADAGKYNVTLTATDNDGLTGNKTNQVTVKTNSTITIAVSPETIMIGGSLTISGSITPTRVGASVTIYHNKTTKTGQIYINLTTVKTNDTSQYAYTWTPTTAGYYTFHPSWPGDDITIGNEATAHTKGPFASASVRKFGSSISISVSPTTITYGGTMTISGSLNVTSPDVPVTIWYKAPTETTWSNITAVNTNETSQYSYTWTPETAGTFEIKTSWAGDTNTAGAQSTIETVTVNKVGSDISISLSPATITLGEDIVITGSINVTRPDASVTIWYRRTGQTAWTNMTTVQTDDASQYTYTWTPLAATTFQLKANWTGDINTDSAESLTATATVNKISSSVSIFLSATTITRGQPITISGAISPKRVGVTVQILVNTPGGMPGRQLATVTTDANGNYTYTYSPDITGNHQYQAKWTGDDNTSGSTSVLAALTVQGAPQQGGIDMTMVAAAVVGIIIIVAIAVVLLRRRKSTAPQA